MKIRLIIMLVISSICMVLPAQNSHNKKVLTAFSDSIRELSSSYYAYHRLWDDMDVPSPKWIKANSDYYKLFVPPTFYVSPIEQAFSYEWEPITNLGMVSMDTVRLGMTASDSLYSARPDSIPEFVLPELGKSVKVDRWVNRILLNYYMQYPERVMGNELYFADVILLDDVQVINAPRQEKMKNYMKVVNPVEKASAENELLVVKPNFWKKTAAASMQFSQHSISDNWYQGGESTNALLSEIKLTANYDDRQRIQFENSLEIKLGFITAPSDTVHEYKTNADLFRLNSKLGVRAIKNLYYTLAAEFKTQFFPNYKTNTNDLISSFLSPAQLDLSVGMDYKLTKKKYKLSVMGAPFSYTFVYIKNDSIVNPSSFNVEKGHSSASLFGSKITMNFDWKIAKNISFISKMDYFTTYEKVIANWENTFNFQLNRYLSTKLFIHTRFDDGVKLKEDEDSYFQIKEMLTFGLSYTW